MKQVLHLTLGLGDGRLGSAQITVDCDDDAEGYREGLVAQIDEAVREAFQFRDIAGATLDHVTITKPVPGVFDQPQQRRSA